MTQPNESRASQPQPATGIDPHGPPPRLAEDEPANTQSARLEKFLAAYHEAINASDPAAELGLLADHLRHHFVRTPGRHFRSAGKVLSESKPDGSVRVILPLRFELPNGSAAAVTRVLLLQPRGADHFQILQVQDSPAAP